MFALLANAQDAGLTIDVFYVVLRIIQVTLEAFMLLGIIHLYHIGLRIQRVLTIDTPNPKVPIPSEPPT